MKKLQFNLYENAILIRTNIRMWSGKTKDLELSAITAAQNNASTDAVESYTAALEKFDRKPIEVVANEARNWLADNTNFWDTGVRLVATNDYERVRTKLDGLRISFYEELNRFLARRDDLAVKAKSRLGILFKGFPEREELAKKYEFSIRTEAIARTDDIRLRHVDTAAIQEIEKHMMEMHAQKLTEVNKNLLIRIQTVLSNFAEAMGRTYKLKGGEEVTRWSDTIITNIFELLDVVPALNISNDAQVNAIAKRIGDEMRTFQADTLRKDKGVREQAQSKARDLMAEVRKLKISDSI